MAMAKVKREGNLVAHELARKITHTAVWRGRARARPPQEQL